MFEQCLSATPYHHPLLKVKFYPTDTAWQEQGRFFQTNDWEATDPRDGIKHSMRGMATAVNGVQFSKSEQFVTYPDGSVQQEEVYWDTALQIYYWQSQMDHAWYFEDPCNDDAITKVSSYKKLLRQFDHRQFWWLEPDEDVTVSKNPDGSKCYSYKGLHDPAQITALLEAEAEQARMTSEKPVSKWKAAALSAMTLLGNAAGFQSLAKSYVSAVEPRLSASPSVEQPTHPASVDGLGTYSLMSMAYQPQAFISVLGFGSVMATSVASMVRPRLGRVQSLFGFTNLLTSLTVVPSVNGQTMIEGNKKAFSPNPTRDLSNTETFTHVFSVPTFSSFSDASLSPELVVHANEDHALEVPFPPLTTIAPHLTDVLPFAEPVAALEGTTVTSAVEPTSLEVPLVHLSARAESMQAKLPQEVMKPLVQKTPTELFFSSPLPLVSAKTTALSSEPMNPRELQALSDVLQMVDNASKEVERCTREVEEKVRVNDEKSAQEKAHAVQILNNLRLALSKISQLLRKIENSPNHATDVDIRETKILEDALTEVKAYFNNQVPESGLNCFTDSKDTPTVGENFLSTVSTAIADVDSNTISIVLGSIFGIFGIGSLAAYMMMNRGAASSDLAGSVLREQSDDPSRVRLSTDITNDPTDASRGSSSKRQRQEGKTELSPADVLQKKHKEEFKRYAAAIMPDSLCREAAQAAFKERRRMLGVKLFGLVQGSPGAINKANQAFLANVAGITISAFKLFEGEDSPVVHTIIEAKTSDGGFHSEPLALGELIINLMKEKLISEDQGLKMKSDKTKYNTWWLSQHPSLPIQSSVKKKKMQQEWEEFFAPYKDELNTVLNSLVIYSERSACKDCARAIPSLFGDKYGFFYSINIDTEQHPSSMRNLRAQFVEAIVLDSHIEYLKEQYNPVFISPGLEYGQDFLIAQSLVKFNERTEQIKVALLDGFGSAEEEKKTKKDLLSSLAYIEQFFKKIQAIQKKRDCLYRTHREVSATKKDTNIPAINRLETQQAACTELFRQYTNENKFTFLYNAIQKVGYPTDCENFPVSRDCRLPIV